MLAGNEPGSVLRPPEVHALAYVDDPRRLLHGNRVRLLRDGSEAFAAMFEAIDTAASYVHLESYIFRADKTGQAFAARLLAARERGAQVALVFDSLGSRGLSDEFAMRLAAAGIQLLAYHPFRFRAGGYVQRRNHRKILVVDGTVGFTGGLNVADDYAPAESGGGGWRDTHVRIEGPAVRELDALFRETWRAKKGTPLAEPITVAPRGRDSVAIVGNTELRGRWAIRRALLYALSQASRYVFIANAYFVPDGGILRALRLARARGVEVWLMVPGVSDVPAVRWASRAVYARLLRWGVRVFEWKRPMLHAKTVVVDGLWSTVGSYNLDHRSLRHNLEVTAVIPGEHLGAGLTRMFRDDLTGCVEVREPEWSRRPWYHRWLERMAYWFRSLW